MVESEIDGWGLEVAGIRIQDIELPEPPQESHGPPSLGRKREARDDYKGRR